VITSLPVAHHRSIISRPSRVACATFPAITKSSHVRPLFRLHTRWLCHNLTDLDEISQIIGTRGTGQVTSSPTIRIARFGQIYTPSKRLMPIPRRISTATHQCRPTRKQTRAYDTPSPRRLRLKISALNMPLRSIGSKYFLMPSMRYKIVCDTKAFSSISKSIPNPYYL
jgi:hypothetical protein